MTGKIGNATFIDARLEETALRNVTHWYTVFYRVG